ncbi:MAG: hypothetical protein ACREC9_06240 [Methylocella sp.]
MGAAAVARGGEADHLAPKVGAGTYRQTSSNGHHFGAHRSVPRSRCDWQTHPQGKSPLTAQSRARHPPAMRHPNAAAPEAATVTSQTGAERCEGSLRTNQGKLPGFRALWEFAKKFPGLRQGDVSHAQD